MTSQRTIKDLKKRYAKTLMAHPSVASVGVERDQTGDYHLVVQVTEEAGDLPEEIEGHRLAYVRTEGFEKL